MNEQEKQFQTGFNHGYILTAHEPEMIDAIIKAAHDAKSFSEYSYGLTAGHDMYIVDNILPEKGKLSKPAKELEKLDTPEKKFTKGFNAGYLIAKHDPELCAKIIKIPNQKSEYFKGIVSGKQEHDMEKLKMRVKTMSQNKTPNKNFQKNKGREK